MLSIRKIGAIGRTYRHLNRYSQILGVLFKYGFGDLLESMKIDQVLGITRKMFSGKRPERDEHLTRPKRLRLAIEELGSTFIKLGQILSTRPDLIPPDYVKELSKLLDEVPPFAFGDAKAVIESELGASCDAIFSELGERPLASASIGQVHRAVLINGERVAVKVRRPGIHKIIEVDLEILLHLATLAERHVEELALHRPIKIIEEFARTLEKEIDYCIEATNTERMARQFLEVPYVYIPKVYREASTEKVLTTEYVEGIKISKIEKLDAAGVDRKLLTERGADLVLSQVFEHGFFHADPHPGNIFVLADNVLCLVDFGMVGIVDQRTQEDFVDLLDNIIHENEVKTAQVLLKLTDWEEQPELRAFERAVADFSGRHLYKPLKDIEFSKMLHELLELATKFRLRIPPDIFLMMKAISTVESVARSLDPGFNMVAQARPFIEQVKLDRYKPKRIAEELIDVASRLVRFAQQFPSDLLELAALLRQHRLGLQIELKDIQNLLATHDRVSNRLSFSIIIAALIIGSALIVISETPPLVYGISLIGIIGFFAAAIMGVWLLVAIIKRGL